MIDRTYVLSDSNGGMILDMNSGAKPFMILYLYISIL